MATRVRSFSKINLGLAIGPVRGDGFHALTTMYQTLELHDVVTVAARRVEAGAPGRIVLTTNHAYVPVDGRNTAWKMVEGCLARLGVAAEVTIDIEKRLPVQGGLGAGSANAAAALLGLERELGVALGGVERLELAATVGSDVPLFMLGGSVLGLGRGEQVVPLPELPAMACVVAVPGVGVSTPAAFRAWDAKTGLRDQGLGTSQPKETGVRDTALGMSQRREAGLGDRGSGLRRAEEAGFREPGLGMSGSGPGAAEGGGLTSAPVHDTLARLSLAYASMSAKTGVEPGTSGILHGDLLPEKQQGSSDEQSGAWNDLAENTLLALVRTGIGSGLQNDFEEVVFPQYPSLRETKRLLMGSDSGSPAVYAALSGSGSALFGLYRSIPDARAAQQRVQASGVQALLTATLPRADYWRRMFAG